MLVALASVTCLGFGSAFVMAGSKASASQIGLRLVSVHDAAGRTAATLTVCASPPGEYSTIQDAVDHAHGSGVFDLF